MNNYLSEFVAGDLEQPEEVAALALLAHEGAAGVEVREPVAGQRRRGDAELFYHGL